MGYGLILKDVYISKARKDTLKEEKEELINFIEDCETRIYMLCSQSPHNIHTYEDWNDYIKSTVKDILESLDESYKRLTLIELALDSNDLIEY